MWSFLKFQKVFLTLTYMYTIYLALQILIMGLSLSSQRVYPLCFWRTDASLYWLKLPEIYLPSLKQIFYYKINLNINPFHVKCNFQWRYYDGTGVLQKFMIFLPRHLMTAELNHVCIIRSAKNKLWWSPVLHNRDWRQE